MAAGMGVEGIEEKLVQNRSRKNMVKVLGALRSIDD